MQLEHIKEIQSQALYRQVFKMMGSRFEICLVEENRKYLKEVCYFVIEEMSKVENLFTTFDENSFTSRINKYAGISPVHVDKRVFELIESSIKYSQLSDGAFDITYSSFRKEFLNFDINMTFLPYMGDNTKRIEQGNYKNIILDKEQQSVFLNKNGMRIGFGGIAKGYVADYAASLFMELGFDKGIVNASGDIKVWGTPSLNCKWSIGIKDPNNKEKIILSLKLQDKAIASSGNYEKFVMIGDDYYSHTIDPKSGYPIKGLKSVTIVSQDAIFSDAIATSINVLGIEAGIALVKKFNDVDYFIIDNFNQFHYSSNISDILYS